MPIYGPSKPVFGHFQRPGPGPGPMTEDARVAKLEAAVKAALRLRRKCEDITPISPMLSVPRLEVKLFDAVIESLKGENVPHP